MIDLLLVNPGDRRQLYQELGSISAIEPPFWAGLIASFIRKHGYNVAILDADAENLTAEEAAKRVAEYNPLLTCVIAQGSAPATSSTPKMAAAGAFLRALKSRAGGLATLLGGIHPSALPERTLQEEKADYVIQGEGFYTILELLNAAHDQFRHGWSNIKGLWEKYGSTPCRASLISEDQLPPVAWDLLPMNKYRAHNWQCLDRLDHRSPYGVIYTSLGCPFSCSFCNIHQMYLGDKPSIRYRKAEDVVQEIDLLVTKYGVRNIKVMDELFTLRKDLVSDICDLLIERGYDLNIWAYGRVGLVNPELLRKMKKAGINWVCYGFESESELVRRGVAKKLPQGKMNDTVAMTRDAGIHIQANFIFGLPDDDLETMEITLQWAKAWNFEWVNFYCAGAYPGSKLYEDAVAKGLPLPQSWADYGQYSEGFLPLPTKYLPGKEVLKFRDSAFADYFSRFDYLEMIERKFGDGAVEHIKEMLKHKIQRRWL